MAWYWWLGIAVVGGLGIFAWLKGVRIGAIVAAVGAGLMFWKGSMSRAERRGRDVERQRQTDAANAAIQRGNEAEEAERERQRKEGPGTHPPGADWIVDRHTGRVPDDGRSD